MLTVGSLMILQSVCTAQPSSAKQETLHPSPCIWMLLAVKVMVSFFLPLHALHSTINFVSSPVKDLILSMYFPLHFLVPQSEKEDIRLEIAFRKYFSIYVMYVL